MDNAYHSHIFVSRSIPDRYEIHCLVAHLTDKSDIGIKVVQNGRVVSVVTRKDEVTPVTVNIETNSFEYKRSEPAALYQASAGDIATISVQLCYRIKQRRPNGKDVTVDPIDFLGRIKKEVKKHFLSYLEGQTGLTGLVDGSAEIGIFRDGVPDSSDMQHKVWFIGSVFLTIRARVNDADVFNRLSVVAIGKRRSYGFGAVACDFLEPGALACFDPLFSP